MLCLSLVSQFPLGPSLCHGSLLRRGSLLLCRGGLLLHYGGLLPCSGGLLLRLLWSGGLLPCSGGLPLCLLWPGGLLPRLLRRGGLLSRQLHPGGLLLCLLRPGGLPLHRGDLRVHLHCYGGFLLHPFCRLHYGPLFCRSCLSPKVLHLLHGPGPLSLPLFRLRSTTLLDCVMFGASGSRSLGGGGALS